MWSKDRQNYHKNAKYWQVRDTDVRQSRNLEISCDIVRITYCAKFL